MRGDPDNLIHALLAIDTSDPESAHGKADDLIRDWLPEEIRQAYDRVARRCAWWGCA